jgi:hypothetical protein
MADRKLFYIVTAPLVESLRAEGFPMPEPPIRFYPDGSLWTDDHRLLLRYSKLGTLEEPKSLVGTPTCCFRPLLPFGGDYKTAPHYEVIGPSFCDWIGEDEVWTLMYPGVFKEATEDENDLAHIRVLIKLRRKFSAAIAEELAGVLRIWFAEIGSQGVFGEAGLKSISPKMRWLDRSAGFTLDARGSGQETLNTLYLAVLNWGMNQRRPLVSTNLAADRNEAVFSSDQSVPLV